jgi:uncharacterized Fe-S center protein
LKSKVYFIAVGGSDNIQTINHKLKQLIDESRIFDFIQKRQKVAVKMHFGEEGNTGFINPNHLGVICGEITNKGAAAFLTDTNTLYQGRRMNSTDHLKIAREHGFTKEVTGAEVIIPDDTKEESVITKNIDQKLIKTARVARFFIEADGIVAVNHFKGHMLTGFGGALKNIGMGCATREGKLAQHCDVSPVIDRDKCIGCGACEKICPVNAIHIENSKSVINKSVCTGCANCIGVCPTWAMSVDLEAGQAVQKKMVEYAWSLLKGREKRVGFINFAIKINKECDCWGMDNPRIADDVGIFASSDPVSIDKACFDLVNKSSGKDIFKASHPDQDGMIQLEYAQNLDLGNLDYELINC